MLSKRLIEVSKFVKPQARLVDVGSDHAYLPISLIENKTIDFAIAGEVAAGPLHNSEQNISYHNLEDKIQARLGDGLDVIEKEDQIDTAVIAGMGGILITEILQRFVNRQEFTIESLILQPNIGESLVRSWLMEHNYEIVNENILAEDGHSYEIIVGKLVSTTPEYSREDLLVGPILKKNKNSAFIDKWNRKLKKYRKTLVGISNAQQPDQEKIQQVKADINILEGLLND
ncbi:tRNA (adenine(22)-N(1))-methyltransferase TrmK [Companilactobacillus sp. RD055328]|uniref:tRNA (adenine(22)-N(1))-methyltransferase n=1 Tax=Companilactobacillus sp. RD055328 TaxID=2916634 RepID=UPI001FC82791|nr:tRNA (adenine(22)-N(1))-methyltransferase TrmK [Companilactobacillus sp. RD055328]